MERPSGMQSTSVWFAVRGPIDRLVSEFGKRVTFLNLTSRRDRERER